MPVTVKALAARGAKQALETIEFDLPELDSHRVDIAVESCGICHSDLSMLDNEWGMTGFPLVPGHEVVGRVAAVGDHVGHLKVGQRVGLGWFSGSCMACRSCISGGHNLCGTAEQTIVGAMAASPRASAPRQNG